MPAFTTSPSRQLEIERLAKILRDLPLGEIASYQALNKAAGRDVQTVARASLYKAWQNIEEADGTYRFSTVKGVGVSRLETANLAGIGGQYRKRIRRTARTGFRRLTGISTNSLSVDDKRRIQAERSLLGAIDALSSNAAAAEVHTPNKGSSVKSAFETLMASMAR